MEPRAATATALRATPSSQSAAPAISAFKTQLFRPKRYNAAQSKKIDIGSGETHERHRNFDHLFWLVHGHQYWHIPFLGACRYGDAKFRLSHERETLRNQRGTRSKGYVSVYRRIQANDYRPVFRALHRFENNGVSIMLASACTPYLPNTLQSGSTNR